MTKKETKKMKRLKGTKTEKNLMEAFAGESQARNKYTYYSSRAKKDGYEQIAEIFAQTADNEKEHAKIWFKYLHGRKCIKEWRKKQGKKVSTILLSSLPQ